MEELKFYRCKKCGQMVAAIKKSSCPVFCCGEEMGELVAGTVEASREKHIPEWKQEGNKVHVQVGSILHPMIDVHYIEWILIRTEYGNQRHCLKPGDEPVADFTLNDGDKVLEVYAYCNLHGLWKS